jgi:hypothetical protein
MAWVGVPISYHQPVHEQIVIHVACAMCDLETQMKETIILSISSYLFSSMQDPALLEAALLCETLHTGDQLVEMQGAMLAIPKYYLST